MASPEQADVCNGCKKGFNFINRRHHCRNCEKTFCNTCSHRTIIVEKFGLKDPVRVCESCFMQLKGEVSATEKDLKRAQVQEEAKKNTMSAAQKRASMSTNPLPQRSNSTHLLPDTMPEHTEVERLFEDFMEEKCMKTEARVKMRTLPLGTKWLMMTEDQKQQERDGDKTKNNPSHWARLFKSGNMKAKELKELKIILASQGKSWIIEFRQQGGLEGLLTVLGKSDPETKTEALACFKAFMNNEAGLKEILDLPAATDQIVSTLTSEPNVDCRKAVLGLLTVLCWVSQKGWMSVVKSLSTNVVRRFQSVVSLLGTENAGLTLDTLTFINAFINACEELEMRIGLRNEFLDLGIVEKMDRIRQRSSGEGWGQAVVQCDLFEDARQLDKRDTMRDEVDLSDPDSMWNFLKQWTVTDGLGTQLLEVMQSLLATPSGHAGRAVWDDMVYYAQMRVKQEYEEGPIDNYAEAQVSCPHHCTIEQLKDYLGRRDEVGSGGGGGGGGGAVVSRAPPKGGANDATAAQLAELTDKLNAASQESSGLRSELAVLKADLAKYAAGGAPPAPGPPPPPGAPGLPPPAPGLDGAGPPPPPPPPGDIAGGPPPPPPPPGGIAGGPPPPPPPPLLGGGPPPPPPLLGGGPPPPPGAPMLAAPVPQGPPPKPVIKPSQKLRAFHWVTVAPLEVEKTLWKDLDDAKALKLLDKNLLENQFAEKAPEKKEDKEGTPKEPKKAKKETVSLLDPQRAQNVNIALSRFGVAGPAIKDAVLAMDEKVIDEEKAAALLKCVPQPEELEMIQLYDGPADTLGDSEKFFKIIADVPNLKNRVELWLFKLQFPFLVTEVEAKLDACEAALSGLKNSENLKRMLELILAIGNYLNGGTKKGGAFGFKLATLTKLKATKSTDNKTTLLDFIITLVNAKCPNIKGFVNDLSALPDACKVEASFLSGEVAKLTGSMNRVDGQLKNPPKSDKDKFNTVMEKFLQQNKARADRCKQRLDGVLKGSKELAEQYGEDAPMEELFRIFETFTSEYASSERELNRKSEEAERQAKRDAEAEERKRRAVSQQGTKPNGPASPVPAGKEGPGGLLAAAGSPGAGLAGLRPTPKSPTKAEADAAGGAAGGGAVDNVIGSLKGDNSGDILQVIRARRQQQQQQKEVSKKVPGSASFMKKK